MGALQHGQDGPLANQNFGWLGNNAFGSTNNWPVCSLILRKISKIVATICQIIRLKCTKFAFHWGLAFAPDPAGEVTVLPRPLTVFKGPTSKGRERKKT